MSPPPLKSVLELNTPNHREAWYTVLVSRESELYQNNFPIKRFTRYSTLRGADERVVARFGNDLLFAIELKPGNSADLGNTDLWVIWIFTKQEVAQDTYNANVAYLEESGSHPEYTRIYDIRRDTYDSFPIASPASTLTALLGVTITAPGTNYTNPTATISGAGTGASIEFVLSPTGAILAGIVTAEGSGHIPGTTTITISDPGGSGSGATATPIIQAVAAKLFTQAKQELPKDDPRWHAFVRVIRVYRTYPGPVLTSTYRTADPRGRTITKTEQTALTGTINPLIADGVISSEVVAINAVESKRTSITVAALPPDEVNAFWEYVPIPNLIFDIDHTYYCNNSQFFTLTTNYDKAGGASALRKHRKTVSYSFTYPDPDLSESTFALVSLDYEGKVVRINLNNVLNDALSYNETFYTSSGGSTCGWTEDYDFPASTPSATVFAAGDWYVREHLVEKWGQSNWKSTLIEFYSAPGNPPI